MTFEQLLKNEEDSVLLDIYNELNSCVVPATGYAHAYCRKVNKMIDSGDLCTLPDKYRKVYLPTLSKMIFKEMSRRYAQVLYNEKTLMDAVRATPLERNDGEPALCAWCEDEFDDASELHMTDLGLLCDRCIAAIRSRGETVIVYD